MRPALAVWSERVGSARSGRRQCAGCDRPLVAEVPGQTPAPDARRVQPGAGDGRPGEKIKSLTFSAPRNMATNNAGVGGTVSRLGAAAVPAITVDMLVLHCTKPAKAGWDRVRAYLSWVRAFVVPARLDESPNSGIGRAGRNPEKPMSKDSLTKNANKKISIPR
jgi:hypothetical protein